MRSQLIADLVAWAVVPGRWPGGRSRPGRWPGGRCLVCHYMRAWCLWSGGLGHKRLCPVNDPRPGGRGPWAVARALVAG